MTEARFNKRIAAALTLIAVFAVGTLANAQFTAARDTRKRFPAWAFLQFRWRIRRME